MTALTDQDLVILAILATPGLHRLSYLASDWTANISRLRLAGLVVAFPDDSAYATPKGAHVVREMTTIGLMLGSPDQSAGEISK